MGSTDSDYSFDVDEHYKFLQEVDLLIFSLDVDTGKLNCVECNHPWDENELWECPDTGNLRCSDCQVDHEMNKCPNCRLAYEDL